MLKNAQNGKPYAYKGFLVTSLAYINYGFVGMNSSLQRKTDISGRLTFSLFIPENTTSLNIEVFF